MLYEVQCTGSTLTEVWCRFWRAAWRCALPARRAPARRALCHQFVPQQIQIRQRKCGQLPRRVLHRTFVKPQKRFTTERLSQADCDRIADKLNRRPRKRYDWYTPEELSAPRR